MTNTNMSVYTVKVLMCVFLFSLFVCMQLIFCFFVFVFFSFAVCSCHFYVSLVITVWTAFQMHAHDVM